ncbi:kinesin-like protein KIN-14R isoform X2 [Phoenix dactylifera]|uniref:Kinesin-like protein KIN-14R isoform X2 n=1 Tax=Phoenix dactylifera TaxID=42345 RepID=A0A8B7MU40_PHODC|nr:kinesin-like protein KIN-14R isoform X2 [Phoenix dactylifera]
MAETRDLNLYDPTAGGSNFIGFSTSPDLTVCTSPPDIPRDQIQETPDYIRRSTQRNRIAPMELFSDRESDNFRPKWGFAATMPESSPEMRSLSRNETLEVSLDLGVIPDVQDSLISINAGGIDESIVCGGIKYQKDSFYTGGDVIRKDAAIGDGKELALYQSARVGNSSYKFQNLESGDYLVDLHFAEIIFTGGPPGMRIFDVFMQEEKVISAIDIYAQVGSNQPLILSALRASVVTDEGLTIRFEGLVGQPILCGISIRRDCSEGKSGGNLEPILATKKEILEKQCNDCRQLKQDYDLLLKEQIECKRAVEDLKQEHELKSRECQKAWTSLQELQMELMRKSMHVGSLAFAVEGQVKEKSRWFQSLADLSEKFKLLKLKHAKLSEEALEYRWFLADITNMTTTVQSTVDHHLNLEEEYKDLKLKYVEEAKERKDLYNKIIELKGNIRVFCRCRPLNAEEIAGGASVAVDFESAKDGELIVKGHVSSKKVFKFDSVFSPEEDQEKVFEKTAPLATSVLDGYNVCIFAYGQTGTGKTFTMEGTEEARGVNYRTLEELFRIIRERQGLFQYEITVSVLEVYNEQIRDLLLMGSQPGVAAKRLEVRQVAEGVHHVPGMVEAHVSNMDEVWEVLQTGSKARAVGSTNANEHSSRSHCIHCVMVRGENLVTGECTRSKLWLIDLAGSERVAKTDAQGERLKEAQNINKSLSALGDVISALATKSPHIPFRNSKLTHLLQDSLGGDSKTLMFVQISPNENDVGETLCSLNFASRVRGIELGPAKKQVDVSELFRYKQMVGKAKQESKNKDAQITKMEDGIHSLEMRNKAKDLAIANLQEKVKELESQLLIERKLARQHVDAKIAENQLQLQQLKEQEDPNISLMNPQSVIRPMSEKFHNHVAEQIAAIKEIGNGMRPLVENNMNRPMMLPPTDNNILKCFPSPNDKENKPELAEEHTPRKASRVSLFSTARQVPATPVPRRYSLIPLPTSRAVVAPPPPLPPTMGNLSPPLPSSLLTINGKDGPQPRSTKKINSILRRSLQKKVIIRSPLPQTIRRGGIVGGAEKVRVSIGGSGRKARRLPVNNGTKADRLTLQKHQKEKEKGWNHRTTARNIC